MKVILRIALSVAVFAAVFCGRALPVRADVLPFDDLHIPFDLIPNGYHGFNWFNFLGWDTTLPNVQSSGYTVSVISPKNIAYNGGGDPAELSSVTPFTFVGAYFTAAWYDGLNVRIEGFRNNVPLYDTTFNPLPTAPTFFAFNYVGVDTLRFSSFGGTQHPGFTSGGLGTQFAMDDFTFVPTPEPSSLTLWLSAAGCGAAGAFLGRRRVAQRGD